MKKLMTLIALVALIVMATGCQCPMKAKCCGSCGGTCGGDAPAKCCGTCQK